MAGIVPESCPDRSSGQRCGKTAPVFTGFDCRRELGGCGYSASQEYRDTTLWIVEAMDWAIRSSAFRYKAS